MATSLRDPPRLAQALVRKALAPIERFLAVETSSGLVLLAFALVALGWANSPWAGVYQSLQHDVHFWINDGLMTVFFFVVGLEIRREIHQGELSELKRAALPLVAALGGMLVPALIYVVINFGRASARGWGVPMATDIAFAVGVLALFGNRVLPAMRILLLALAVIDDVGAIVVIAAFYSSGLNALGFAIAGLGMAAIVGLQRLKVNWAWVYAAPVLVVWLGAYRAGIHPTLAGVVVGLMTPVAAPPGEISPGARLEHALHGWVAYGIMPLFALANAGVPLGNASLSGDGLRVFIGVCAGLVLGKPLGIAGASWLARKAGVAVLPSGMDWLRVTVVGAVGGIGFTMALFIAALAFPPGPLLETAKLAILAGSGGAAALAFVASRRLPERVLSVGVAGSDAEAEASTEA